MNAENILSQSKDVWRHLQQLAGRQIQLQVFDSAGAFLSKGWILCEPGNENRLAISPQPIGAMEAQGLICRYIMEEKLFTFTTRPLGGENGDLIITPPSSIRFQNRRKNCRVQTRSDKPVFARIDIPKVGVVLTLVLDISPHGFCALLPHRAGFISKDEFFQVDIVFQDGTSIRGTGTVKNISAFMHVWRVGFSFSGTGENSIQELMSYCNRREFEMMQGDGEVPVDWKRVKVAIIEAKDQNPPHLFLQKQFNVKSAEHLHAIKLLRDFSPEMIIIDMSHPGAKLVLKTVSKDPALRFLPLLLLDRKLARVKGRPGAVETFRIPYHPDCLSETIEKLVTKYRLAENCRENAWKIFTGAGKKIMVLASKKNLDRIHTKLLKENEYDIFTISDELDIVQRIASVMPDVIILDDETQRTDAATIYRLINLNKTLRRIPKIRLVSEGVKAEKATFEGYDLTFLNKPVSFKQLVESINQSLGRSLQTSNTSPTSDPSTG